MDKTKFLNAGHAGGVLFDEKISIGFDLIYQKWSVYGGAWMFKPHPIKVSQPDYSVSSHLHEDHWDTFYKTPSGYETLPMTNQYRIFKSSQTLGDASLLYRCQDGFSFYHGNDNVPRLLELEIGMKELGINSVDLALIPFEYNGWFPHCFSTSENKRKLLDKACEEKLNFGLRIAKTLKAKTVILTGNDLVYTGKKEMVTTKDCTRESVLKRVCGMPLNAHILNPGDSVTKKGVIKLGNQVEFSFLESKFQNIANALPLINIEVFGSKPIAWRFSGPNSEAKASYIIEIDKQYCDPFLKGMPFELIAHARGFTIHSNGGEHKPEVWQTILANL